METNKTKTLAECKDEVARLRAYKDWQDMYLRELQINSGAWTFLLKCTEEAAELYAGQTKQSYPVSEDLEKRLSDLYDKWVLNYEYMHIMPKDLFMPAVQDWQSQQPESVAWLSEVEIFEKCPVINCDPAFVEAKRNGAIWLQSELRKRVIDPVDFAIGFKHWCFEYEHAQAYIGMSDEELVSAYKEYITHKTK